MIIEYEKNMDLSVNNPKGDFIKSFIITLHNDGESTYASRKLIQSISTTKSQISPFIFPATTPNTLTDINQVHSLSNKNPKWSWPTNEKEDGLDFNTGLYKRHYKTNDIKKVIACMISHMRLWQTCIDINEPIMILESDAIFKRQFKWSDIRSPKINVVWDHIKKTDLEFISLMNMYPEREQQFKKDWEKYANSIQKSGKIFDGGVLGLNSPWKATRKQSVYNESARKSFGIKPVPSVDKIGDDPLPQGLAGNSAYIIKPWAANKLLEKVDEIGLWPNDALMCKQFFPWMQIIYPYYTTVQGTKSSTTGQQF